MTHPLVHIARYLSGRPLDGRPGYPYLRPGEGRWAGWHRQVARLAVPAAAITALHEPAATEHAGVVLAAGAAIAVHRRLKHRRFRRAYVSPTLRALQPVAGGAPMKLHVDRGLGSLAPRLIRPPSPARRAVGEWYGEHVEPVVRWPGTTAMRGAWRFQAWAKPATDHLEMFRRPVTKPGPRIQLDILTPYLTNVQREAVSAIIRAKIPVADTVEQWDQVGAHVAATWTVRRRPPLAVGLPELDAAFSRLTDAEFYLGQTSANEPMVVSLDDDSPHILVSAGSGAGKSVYAQLVAIQILRRGGIVVILDRKGSHRWARGVPGVEYCTKPEQMHDALLKYAELAQLRNDEGFDKPDEWRPDPRVLIICEELNGTIGQLRAYWDRVREKGEPKKSPAIDALGEILFMGRSALVHVFAIGQMLTARTLGGPEARENFAIRCLSRYSNNAWKMLVPECAMPRRSRVRGRWQIVVNGEASEVQVAFLTRAQAREFAGVTGRTKGPDSPMTSSVAGNATETGNTLDPLSEPISIRDAIDEGILPWGKDATKMRLTRARKAGRPVPAAVGKRGLQTDLYRRGDLIVWAESERVS